MSEHFAIWAKPLSKTRNVCLRCRWPFNRHSRRDGRGQCPASLLLFAAVATASYSAISWRGFRARRSWLHLSLRTERNREGTQMRTEHEIHPRANCAANAEGPGATGGRREHVSDTARSSPHREGRAIGRSEALRQAICDSQVPRSASRRRGSKYHPGAARCLAGSLQTQLGSG